MTRRLQVRTERWPIAGRFTIARGSRTEAVVVVAEIGDGARAGRGECVPYPRYGETVEGVVAAIEAMAPAIEGGLGRAALRTAMPPGAARNAIDCALWDLESKSAGRRAWELAGLAAPAPVDTAFTISLDTPEAMAARAVEAAQRPLLKIKLGAPGDPERIAAVREAAPGAVLIADANEGWTRETLAANAEACRKAGFAMIEQPLPAGADDAVASIRGAVPLCADESMHGRADIAALARRYDLVNVKLDKAGGLTEAIEIVAAARDAGLGVFVGCMVGTSLAMAPALLLAGAAAYVDLDGPLLLARDRPEGLRYEGSRVHPPAATLWG